LGHAKADRAFLAVAYVLGYRGDDLRGLAAFEAMADETMSLLAALTSEDRPTRGRAAGREMAALTAVLDASCFDFNGGTKR